MNDGPIINQRLAAYWGDRVRDRRVNVLQLSQEQVARASKGTVTQQTISNVEAGRGLPSDETKLHLAAALGTTPGDLFEWPDMTTLRGAA